MTAPATEEAFRDLRLAVSGYLAIMDEGDAMRVEWKNHLHIPESVVGPWVKRADAALMLVRAAIERLPP